MGTPPEDNRGACCIGLLYPGEMGTALGQLLRGEGHQIVTTLEGRGQRTSQNAAAAGFAVLDSLAAVVRSASVIVSLVPPATAVSVARQVREQIGQRPRAERLIYVDMNSASPRTVQAVAAILRDATVDFVDGAISGPAAHLTTRGVLYLSGSQAQQVAALFHDTMRVQVLGRVPGQASALRMLLSGVSKGVIALFIEMALAARQAGILDTLLSAYRTSYPGIMELVERSLPTFPRHAARRSEEMHEVESTVADLGLRPTVLAGIARLFDGMSHCWPADSSQREWSVAEILESLHDKRMLRGPG